MDLLTLTKAERSTAEEEDLVQKATGLAGTIAPLAGGAAAAVGIVSGALLLLPVGTAVAIAGIWELMRRHRQIRSSLDVMRQDEIRYLNNVAKETREWFVLHASLAGEVVIVRALEILRDHRRQLAQHLVQLRERTTQPEAVEQQEFIDQLDVICKSGAAALHALADYTT